MDARSIAKQKGTEMSLATVCMVAISCIMKLIAKVANMTLFGVVCGNKYGIDIIMTGHKYVTYLY